MNVYNILLSFDIHNGLLWGDGLASKGTQGQEASDKGSGSLHGTDEILLRMLPDSHFPMWSCLKACLERQGGQRGTICSSWEVSL